MRTKPLIGHKAWFGPRRWGWGLSPATAEGWAVLVIGVRGSGSVNGLLVLSQVVTTRWAKGTAEHTARELNPESMEMAH